MDGDDPSILVSCNVFNCDWLRGQPKAQEERSKLFHHIIHSGTVLNKMRVAIKRLKKEFDEIEKTLAELPFTVHPLEDNFLEWHFTVHGPTESVYEDGLYHGRIIFPADYPFSPPTLMFLTASGRFQTATKICLSVTGFHPEHWQPAWGVRTMLIAIRDHFTTEDPGAIGYLGYSADDRKRLARESRKFTCPACSYRPLPLNVRGGDAALGQHPDPSQRSSVSMGETPENLPPKPTTNNSGPLFGFLVILSVAILVLAINYYNHTGPAAS